MRRMLICCAALLAACCVQGCARQRPACTGTGPGHISIDKAVITVNGSQVALPAAVASLERVLGEASRVVSEGDVANIYVWDDAGIYAHQYKFVQPAQVGELSIALQRGPFDLDFYPKRYFTGSLCVDDVRVTKDSTVADVNRMREGEKFGDELGGLYWSVKYGQRSVGLIVNQQQLITIVAINDGLMTPRVEVR